MNNQPKSNKRPLSKGERLKWTLLSELKPVILNAGLLEGHRVEFEELRRLSKSNNKFFVP